MSKAQYLGQSEINLTTDLLQYSSRCYLDPTNMLNNNLFPGLAPHLAPNKFLQCQIKPMETRFIRGRNVSIYRALTSAVLPV